MSRDQDGAFIAWSDGSELGKVDSLSGRVALLHDFANDWSLYLAVDVVDDDTQPIPTSIPEGYDADNNVFTTDPAAGVDCNKPTQALWSGCFEDYSSNVKTWGTNMEIQGPLFGLDFRSITGYRELDDDLDSNFGNFNYQQQTTQDQFSQEFILSSAYDGPFNFVTGLYYFEEDASLDYLFALPATISVNTDAWAIYGEGTYKFTDAWELRAGLRYTDESKDMSGRSIFFTDVLGAPGYARVDKRNFDSTDYRLALQYYATDDIMLFASNTTGFKSGGYSPDCFSPLPVCMNPVEPESVDTWEVGARTELVDNRLRLNFTYFYNTYDDLQLGGSTPAGFIRYNVPEVQTDGVEIEWTFQATENFTLDGFVAYNDGAYTEVNQTAIVAIAGAGPNPICGGQIPDADCLYNNFDLKNLPEWIYAVAGNHFASLGDGYDLQTRVSVAYEDESFNLTGNPSAIKREDTTMVDARVTLINPNNTWSVALWGKNLLDEVYYPSATTVGAAALGVPGLAFAGMPRTYGVDLRYTFD
jgi:iron complex outermembrane receptor protein